MPKNKLRNATIRDVANEAGVSAMTVTRSFCPGKVVSEDTRNRVLATAKKLGYIPNGAARSLRGCITKTAAIIISSPQIRMLQYNADMILLLGEELNKKNYSTFSLTMSADSLDNLHLIRELIGRGVEHFFFIGAPIGYLELEETVLAHGCSCIGFSPDFHHSKIYRDVENAFRNLYGHYLKVCGDDFRIVILEDEKMESAPQMRAMHYLKPTISPKKLFDKYFHTISSLHFNIPDDPLKSMIERGESATRRILDKQPEIKGLVMGGDELAAGAVKVLVEKGYAPGKDVIVSGFGRNFSQMLSFPLISINPMNNEIVKEMILYGFGNESVNKRIQLEIAGL